MALAWLIESAVIRLYNRRRRQRAGRAETPADATAGPPPEEESVRIGQTLPTPSPSTAASPFVAATVVPGTNGGTPVHLALAARRRHLYAIGATGCGKTNFLLNLIGDDIAARRSFCVIDLRGDLVDRVLLRLTAQMAAKGETPDALGRRLLLIDLRQADTVVGFNPLQGPGDAYGRALHVLSVLRQNAESWGVQLEETLRSCLLALAEAGGSLLDIGPLLSDPDVRTQVLAKVTDPYVCAFFESYDALSPERQLNWRLPVLNKVSAFLAVPQVRRMLAAAPPGAGPAPFTFSEMLDTESGRIILVSLAADRLHGAAHLVGGMFVSSLVGAVMARVDIPEARRIPVHLYVDEFENLVSFGSSGAGGGFEAVLAEGRRFGVGLTLSHQNLSQMPLELRHMILNNCNTQLYFQTGATDAAELAREVVPHQTLGETREMVRQRMTVQPVGEAYLLRRGRDEPTPRVRLLPCPDPKVPDAAVAAVRSAALRAFGRPAGEVDRQILGQDALVEEAASPSGGAATARATDASSPPLAPAAKAAGAYEVRHSRAPGRYVPGGRKAAPSAPTPEGDAP